MDFGAIYREYSSKIFRLCLSYLNDPDQAYDVTQETFIAVWQNLQSFKRKSQPGTWIYRIACNKCLRQIENEARLRKVELPFEIEDSNINGQQEQKHIFLRNCIADLPELERIIIGLVLEDVSQEKIAEIVGLSHANIRVKIHRIKKKLTRKFLDHAQF